MTKRFIIFPNNIVWDKQLDEVVCRCILEGIGDAENVCQRLNEQNDTISQLQDLCGESDSENAKLRIENKKLKAKLREKEEDEQLYANEIVKLNKEAKEVLDFKSLGGDY